MNDSGTLQITRRAGQSGCNTLRTFAGREFGRGSAGVGPVERPNEKALSFIYIQTMGWFIYSLFTPLTKPDASIKNHSRSESKVNGNAL